MTNESSGGNLIINTRAAGGTLPLPNVKISVYSGGKLIDSLLTDISGVAGPITIDTPPISDSFIPGSAEKPYSLVDIYAEKTGYYKMQYVDAAIYPGVTSIQQINMIPLPDSPVTDLPEKDTYRFYEGGVPNL